MDVIGLVCGMMFWGVVILAWIAYLIHGKPSKRVRYVGTGILLACVGAIGLLFLRGLYIEVTQGMLMSAAERGDTVAVERDIRWGADVNYVQEYTDNTPLIMAAKGNHTDTVAAILRHHPSKLSSSDMMGKTALHWANERRNKEIIRLLEAAGAKE